MRAAQPGLEIAKHAVDPRQDLACPARVALRACSVVIAHVREGNVASPAIGEHDRPSAHVRAHEPCQGSGRDIGNHLEANPPGRFAPDLNGSDHDRLVTELAPTRKPASGPPM